MRKILFTTLLVFLTAICSNCNNITKTTNLSYNTNVHTECHEESPHPTIVYITTTGTKYHKENCQYLKYSKCRTLLEDAKNAYYQPCSACNP